MKVIITCNIDAYREECFPYPSQVPRVGDLISVLNSFSSHYKNQKLPTLLEVVQVIWYENDTVEVNVHYTKTTIQSAKITGINLYP